MAHTGTVPAPLPLNDRLAQFRFLEVFVGKVLWEVTDKVR
jgi:hypothetical protein